MRQVRVDRKFISQWLGHRRPLGFTVGVAGEKVRWLEIVTEGMKT